MMLDHFLSFHVPTVRWLKCQIKTFPKEVSFSDWIRFNTFNFYAHIGSINSLINGCYTAHKVSINTINSTTLFGSQSSCERFLLLTKMHTSFIRTDTLDLIYTFDKVLSSASFVSKQLINYTDVAFGNLREKLDALDADMFLLNA